MIVLFDSNSYDKLINLSHHDLQKVMARVEKIILPQAVRNELDMMIEREDKMEKLSKINRVIAELDIAKKIEHISTIKRDNAQSYFDSLPEKMKNGDKEIALIAKQEKAIMITDDADFLNGLKSLKQAVLSFEEFLLFN